MKKTLFAILGLALIFSAVSCGTTKVEGSGIKAENTEKVFKKRRMVDYQGAALELEMPEWVKLVANGIYDPKEYQQVMPGIKNKKIFVTESSGPNRQFLKEWTAEVDIKSKIAGTMEMVVGSTIEASTSSTSTDSHDNLIKMTEVERKQALDAYYASLQNIRLTGLEPIAEYWLEFQDLDEEGNPVNDYYTYYAIWAMDQDLFDAQLKEAMNRVQLTTTESEKLKALVGKNLESKMAIDIDEKEAEE